MDSGNGHRFKGRAIVRKLHNFDRTGIVLRVGIACESGESNALHYGEQDGGR
jgi:hypothetical protein